MPTAASAAFGSGNRALEKMPRKMWSGPTYLEIFDDRYQCRSMKLTSQMPVAHWHEQIGGPNTARADSTFYLPLLDISAKTRCAISASGRSGAARRASRNIWGPRLSPTLA